ncbi:fibroblast growth factor 1-like isoform X2 [Xenia sp. Carnegie-2017]|uniref:fibroblast growth factor 1-like isoform X2 n=1 Tax=Xenia sp. Carnegie-2017 TaxID=2897299 RepID=UPI001F041A8E|nr:fibroblast growth factor 1-like isoform X2 [Xenia sp. Carnegie-2017]
MCAIKAITVFAVLFFSGILWMLPTASHGRDFRLAATPRKKILSRYLEDVERIQSGDKSSRRQARHLNFKNHTPSGKMKAQLYCRTGFLLEILDNGRIAGTKNVTSKYTIVEIQVFGGVQRRLKGVQTGRYLSLNSRGRLLSIRNFSFNDNTFFNENHEENGWITYSSTHHSRGCGSKKDSSKNNEWFIAIKRNGSLKRPCKTVSGMPSTQFIPLGRKRDATWLDNVKDSNK